MYIKCWLFRGSILENSESNVETLIVDMQVFTEDILLL